MRGAPFSPQRTADPATDRNLTNVATTFAGILARLDGPLELPQTVSTLSQAIDAGNRAIRYVGAPGGILTLPAASAQGPRTGQLIAVENSTSSPLTVRAGGVDRVNGGASVTVEPRSLLLFAGDAAGGWWTSVGVFGAGGSGHHAGLVPDPGATAGTIRVLFEDATWREIEISDVDGLADALAELYETDTAAAAAGARTLSDVEDLERRFRLLLKHVLLTTGDTPPGLEDEVPIALATE